MKPILQYDSSKEEMIERFICQIDKNPTICTNPLEETTYLDLAFTSFDMYYAKFGDLVKEYKNYVMGFVQSNLVSPESYIYLESTLSWLLTKFQNARRPFVELPLRTEWQILWHTFEISVPNKNAKIILDEKNTRAAYRFFYLISRFQLAYLEDLIAFISGQLLPIKETTKFVNPNKSVSVKKESEIIYVFRLTKTATEQADTILNLLYTNLKRHGHIKCLSREFKRLFADYGQTRPLKSPSPIIWNCEYYNHLAYFVKCLIKNKIITPTKFPSNYKIALQLFNDRYENNFYHPSRERYDGNLNPKDQAKIDSIIEKSLKD